MTDKTSQTIFQLLLTLQIAAFNYLIVHSSEAGWHQKRTDLNATTLILFEESWSSGNFASNNWVLEPSAGNWHINLYQGNPKPSAQFSWSPPLTNYSFSLVSRSIAPADTSGIIQLSFDLLFDDWLSTGYEKMKVHVYDGIVWHQVAEFANNGDIPWTTYHYDITQIAQDKNITLKFQATGQTTVDIDFWRLDNIRVTSTQPAHQPIITVSPDSLFHYLPNPGNTGSWQITLANLGQATLQSSLRVEYDSLFSIQSPAGWLQLPETTVFVIQPDSSTTLSINILSNGMLPGMYSARLIFESNDPLHSELVIPAWIEVGTVWLDDKRKPEVTIFPQPSSKTVNIISTDPIRQLRVIDLSGKLLHETHYPTATFNASFTERIKGVVMFEISMVNSSRIVRPVVFVP